TRGLLWAAVALDAAPAPVCRVIVQTRDAATAQALLPIGKEALTLIGQAAQGRILPPDLAKTLADDIARLTPEVVANRLVLSLALDRVIAVVMVPLRAASESSHRRQCVNNLKQIGLAMHNYLQRHNTFPPAYSRDKENRPLLSWRVHLLPFLEQASLYKEFHL